MSFIKDVAKYLKGFLKYDDFSVVDYMSKQRENRLKRGTEDLQGGLAGMLVPTSPRDPITTMHAAGSLEDFDRRHNYEKRKRA